jgi:hypothetical protein
MYYPKAAIWVKLRPGSPDPLITYGAQAEF